MVTPHQQAITAIEKLINDNLGKSLDVAMECNQCEEEIVVNIVDGVTGVLRETYIGTIYTDITLVNGNGEPVRFIEVVDRHKPGKNVHEYALAHGIDVFEVHLRAEREFAGRRRNKNIDTSLTINARLREIEGGYMKIDAHNILCKKPPCPKCGASLPLRTVAIRTVDCWKCGKNLNVALWHQDGMGLAWQQSIPSEEMEFVLANGVTIEHRWSQMIGGKYLANVCTNCNQICGDWSLYFDPHHDDYNLFITERKEYGPCEKCATRYCVLHDEYLDYQDTQQCPTCFEFATRVMCDNRTDRICLYPDQCQEAGCYFVNRDKQQQQQQINIRPDILQLQAQLELDKIEKESLLCGGCGEYAYQLHICSCGLRFCEICDDIFDRQNMQYISIPTTSGMENRVCWECKGCRRLHTDYYENSQCYYCYSYSENQKIELPY